MKRRTLLATGAGALASLSGCLSVMGERNLCDGEGCDVGMRRMAFVPETFEVTVGDTVGWRNTSGADHTVTAYEGGIPDEAEFFASGDFSSEQEARDAWYDDRGGRIGVRDTYEHTFEVPGTYSYFCIPHERGGMVGQVVVKED
ncbi:MAG: plastocyanin/azurin family copper-binding protein [Halobacteriales archaeon]